MNKKRKMKKLCISFVMALVVFIGLLAIEKHALSKEPKVAVVRAIRDMEAGTLLNEGNVEQYVELDWMETGKVPGEAFKSIEEVLGRMARRDIYQNELLTIQNVKEEKDHVLGIENPVEVSVKVNDVSQVVGGVLRDGDYVDVSVVDGATNENVELLKGAMVIRAIHADGSPITREDKDRSAIIINLIVDKKDEVVLNQNINRGMLRLSKIVFIT